MIINNKHTRKHYYYVIINTQKGFRRRKVSKQKRTVKEI